MISGVDIALWDIKGSAIQVLAGAHAMMGVPNFYRLEFRLASLEAHNAVLTTPLDIRGEDLHLPQRPGLGC